MKKFAIVSLGCPRNLVDSEVIAGSLKEAGYEESDSEHGVDVCVINTCAFVSSAREESVDAIIEAGSLKKHGKIKCLVVAGCLSQLYKSKLAGQLPEADLIVGTSDFPRIAELVDGLKNKGRRSVVSTSMDYIYNEDSPRSAFTPKHYAYVKISEGCSNFCSYCIISRLRGIFRSRSIESIVAEVRGLAASGAIREIELIGQDTTLFGIDRYGIQVLPRLLHEVCELENKIRWVRLLYAHPAHFTDELIDAIASEEKICKYIDLPIQHISDKILSLMNRKVTKREIVQLIEKLRKRIPGLVLRTSVIVGFPQETDKDFKELLSFLKDVKFERLGAFVYSQEEGTDAARMKPQIDEDVKSRRYDEVMKLQQSISIATNKRMLGRKLEILIDEKAALESDKFVGRTQGDAPEIDGTVYVTGKGIKVGEFYKVKITDTLEYDLVGELA